MCPQSNCGQAVRGYVLRLQPTSNSVRLARLILPAFPFRPSRLIRSERGPGNFFSGGKRRRRRTFVLRSLWNQERLLCSTPPSFSLGQKNKNTEAEFFHIEENTQSNRQRLFSPNHNLDMTSLFDENAAVTDLNDSSNKLFERQTSLKAVYIHHALVF